jgi:hypothetical protein
MDFKEKRFLILKKIPKKLKNLKLLWKIHILDSIRFISMRFAFNFELNRIKLGFAGSELFQYFDVFSSSIRSNRTLFLNDVLDTFE